MRVWGVMGLMLLASLPATAQEKKGVLPPEVLGALDMAPARQDGAQSAEDERPLSFEELQLRASVRRALQPTPAARVVNRLDETWALGPVEPEKAQRFERESFMLPLVPSLKLGDVKVGMGTSVKKPTLQLHYKFKPHKPGTRK